VRISTNSGSQETSLVERTPASRGRIIRGPYSPLPLSSSSVSRISSPLGRHGAPLSRVRTPGTVDQLRTPRHAIYSSGAISRRNQVTGAEGAVLDRAKSLILRYTLFDNPLPDVVTLTSKVHIIWTQALQDISDTMDIRPSEESVSLVSGPGQTSRNATSGAN
jgi:hypothetical protein